MPNNNTMLAATDQWFAAEEPMLIQWLNYILLPEADEMVEQVRVGVACLDHNLPLPLVPLIRARPSASLPFPCLQIPTCFVDAIAHVKASCRSNILALVF